MAFRLEEATIEDIHAAFRSGELTCRRLVELYLARIEAYDKNGPELNAIITVNPKVLDQADELDSSFGSRSHIKSLPNESRLPLCRRAAEI